VHKIKVLWILPGKEEDAGTMVFSRRQISDLKEKGIAGEIFHFNTCLKIKSLRNEFFRYKLFIKKNRPDIVHSQYGTITSFLGLMFRTCPYVITFQGSDLNKTPSDGIFRDFFGRKLSLFAAKKADKIICVSESLKQQLPDKLQAKAKVIPFGVDFEHFRPSNIFDARNHLEWKANEKVILFNANNPKVKRLDLAIKIEKIVKKTISNVRLFVLDGKANPEDIPYFINASNVLLLCSDNEGSPTMIKEAMACNLPIVANDVGDVAERIRDVENCYLVNQDVDEMANTIIQTLNSDKQSNGRELLQFQNLSNEKVASKVKELYEEIVN